MRRSDLSRRVSILERTVIPPASIEAKVATLRPEEKVAYENWRKAQQEWHAKFDDPGDIYAAVLNGDRGPQLTAHISEKVFGPLVTFTTGQGLEEIQERYVRQARIRK